MVLYWGKSDHTTFLGLSLTLNIYKLLNFIDDFRLVNHWVFVDIGYHRFEGRYCRYGVKGLSIYDTTELLKKYITTRIMED